jgi:tetratricopeptide (TPR) repeat protein
LTPSRPWIPLCLLFLALPLAVSARQHAAMAMPSADVQAAAERAPVKLLDGMGSLHHPIATRDPDAQKFFDQGLTLFYAFNFDESVRSFTRATEIDPQAPMPYWGLALALGPSYNSGTSVNPTNEKAAYDAIQHAKLLAASGAQVEKDYVDAMAHLFSADASPDLGKLTHDFITAQRDLSERYPDDPDAATLYAAALMDLHSRAMWTSDGQPSSDTLEVLRVLEGVLRKWPDHVGANHYYIHAIEASPFAERALPSAYRLETLVPGAGHLVHMPAHIFVRTGDYSAAVKSNEAAIAVDQSYLRDTGTTNLGYKLGYVEHDLMFLVYSADMDGEYDAALRTAQDLEAQARALLPQMPYVEGYLAPALYVQIRFARWDAILAQPVPDAKLTGMTFFWHYARGCAFAATGKAQQAETELAAMEESYKDLQPEGAAFSMMPNKWETFYEMALRSLNARIAAARGDPVKAVEEWTAAVSVEDHMNYHEPADWFYPMRESLGAALLRGGKLAEAEKTFREDLDKNPRNPHSLFGLWKTLDAEQKPAEADLVRREYEAAWKGGAIQLHIEDF